MKQIKQKLCLITSLAMCVCLSGCDSDNSDKKGSVVPVSSEVSETETTENPLQADYDKLKADYDSLASDYNALKQEISELKSVATEAPTEPPTEAPTESDKVLYEDETVKITYKGTEQSSITDVKLTIENFSDEGIKVQVRDTSVNGIMVDPVFSCDIAAGKKANDEISFYSLKDEGIDKIETIEFYFHVFTAKGWNTIVDTEPITLKFT